MNDEKLLESFKMFLEGIGEDPNRPGIVDTPSRMLKAWKEWVRGYTPLEWNVPLFQTNYRGIVARKQIPFQSFCEHHCAPYRGTISFAYMPNGQVVGLSAMPRIFQHYAARLSIQEDLTGDLLDKFYSYFMPSFEPFGSIIIVTGWHSCESSRGIKVNAPTITSVVRGVFDTDPSVKEEALRLINHE